jgi:hypothetical protein
MLPRLLRKQRAPVGHLEAPLLPTHCALAA